MDRSKARDNLQDLYDVLREYQVRPFLLFGTLLGAYRENNFIEHDKDIDLGITEDLLPNIKKIIHEKRMEQLGFSVMRNWDGIVSFIRNNIYIDIYIFKREKECFCCRITDGNTGRNTGVFKIQSYDMENPRLMKFVDRLFFTPRRVKDYLVHVYGLDFMIPKKNSHANHFQDA